MPSILRNTLLFLIPLARSVPPLYPLRVGSRIFHWYAQLRQVENAVGQRPADELLRELAQMEKRVGKASVPLSDADELYSLRSRIQMVGNRLQAATAAHTEEAA